MVSKQNSGYKNFQDMCVKASINFLQTLDQYSRHKIKSLIESDTPIPNTTSREKIGNLATKNASMDAAIKGSLFGRGEKNTTCFIF